MPGGVPWRRARRTSSPIEPPAAWAGTGGPGQPKEVGSGSDQLEAGGPAEPGRLGGGARSRTRRPRPARATVHSSASSSVSRVACGDGLVRRRVQSIGSIRPPASNAVMRVGGGRAPCPRSNSGPAASRPSKARVALIQPTMASSVGSLPVLVHPLEEVVHGRALGLGLERQELHADEVALEEVAGFGDERLVVGVGVVEDHVVHALARQLLRQGLHAVEVHARRDEVDAGVLHGGDLGADAARQRRRRGRR